MHFHYSFFAGCELLFCYVRSHATCRHILFQCPADPALLHFIYPVPVVLCMKITTIGTMLIKIIASIITITMIIACISNVSRGLVEAQMLCGVTRVSSGNGSWRSGERGTPTDAIHLQETYPKTITSSRTVCERFRKLMCDI